MTTEEPTPCPAPELHDWKPPALTLSFTGVGGTTFMYSPRHAALGGGYTNAAIAFEHLSVAERGALVAICREIIADSEDAS